MTASFPPAANAGEANETSAVVFAGLEVESRSTYASSGGKLVLPVGPETGVFVLGAAGLSLSDARRASLGKLPKSAVAADARLFFGIERGSGPLFASLGIGPSLNSFSTRSGRGQMRAGAAAHADIWYRPTQSDVLNGTAIVDSGPRSLWLRLRYGRKFASLPFALGPEVALSRSVTTRKFRVGLHLSEWLLGPAHLSFATGWLWDRRKPGQYFTLSAYVKY